MMIPAPGHAVRDSRRDAQPAIGAPNARIAQVIRQRLQALIRQLDGEPAGIAGNGVSRGRRDTTEPPTAWPTIRIASDLLWVPQEAHRRRLLTTSPIDRCSGLRPRIWMGRRASNRSGPRLTACSARPREGGKPRHAASRPRRGLRLPEARHDRGPYDRNQGRLAGRRTLPDNGRSPIRRVVLGRGRVAQTWPKHSKSPRTTRPSWEPAA